MTTKILQGDCLDILPTLDADSIDACVTDPPYGLFFMSKNWDHGVPGVPFWQEIYRVLKPGAHLVAMGGTRTYHRMTCAIEDAGFEIRDSIFWVYGVGFPKSRNVSKDLIDAEECCTCNKNVRNLPSDLDSKESLSSGAKQNVLPEMQFGSSEKDQDRSQNGIPEHSLRNLRGSDPSAFEQDQETSENLLQPVMSGKSICGQVPSNVSKRDSSNHARSSVASCSEHDRSEKSSMERRGDVPSPSRQLCAGEICSMSAGIKSDGTSGRISDGASPSNGEADRSNIDSNGMRPSSGSQPAEQYQVEPRTLAGQSQSQNGGAWETCGRCGKPMVPDGLGTALKPAYESIVLARKPLSEGTVAANVLRWGTGALNIGACRVGTEGGRRSEGCDERIESQPNAIGAYKTSPLVPGLGRWPANVVHDGSDEVVAAFPNSNGSGNARTLKRGKRGDDGWGMQDAPSELRDAGKGSAARFFYSAKASKADRAGSNHPTLKPIALMQWLARLITPPGGTVLDPFAGSGTTGAACDREGFNSVLIEREAEYIADIQRRNLEAAE